MFGGFSPSRVAPLFSQRPLSSTLTQQSDQVINGDFLLKRNLLASRQGMSCKSQKASWILTLHLKYATHTYTHTHTHPHKTHTRTHTPHTLHTPKHYTPTHTLTLHTHSYTTHTCIHTQTTYHPHLPHTYLHTTHPHTLTYAPYIHT